MQLCFIHWKSAVILYFFRSWPKSFEIFFIFKISSFFYIHLLRLGFSAYFFGKVVFQLCMWLKDFWLTRFSSDRVTHNVDFIICQFCWDTANPNGFVCKDSLNYKLTYTHALKQHRFLKQRPTVGLKQMDMLEFVWQCLS